jgi:hypothetical protein
MKNLNLVCKTNDLIKKLNENDEYEVSGWVMSDQAAKDVIGSYVYLYSKKSDKSHHGGLILDTYPCPDNSKRKIIKYRALLECKNFKYPKNTSSRSVVTYSEVNA